MYLTNHSHCYFTANGSSAQSYVGVTTTLTWSAAQAHCRQFYTDLAIAFTVTDNDAMQSIAFQQGFSWIGLYRDTWKWSDRTNTSNLMWFPGKPDNINGNDNCAVLDNGMFKDAACNELHYFICHISELFMCLKKI